MVEVTEVVVVIDVVDIENVGVAPIGGPTLDVLKRVTAVDKLAIIGTMANAEMVLVAETRVESVLRNHAAAVARSPVLCAHLACAAIALVLLLLFVHILLLFFLLLGGVALLLLLAGAFLLLSLFILPAPLVLLRLPILLLTILILLLSLVLFLLFGLIAIVLLLLLILLVVREYRSANQQTQRSYGRESHADLQLKRNGLVTTETILHSRMQMRNTVESVLLIAP